MSTEVELVSDGDGLAVIGNPDDVERFFLSAGLDRVPSCELDLHRLWSFAGTAGSVAQAGTEVASRSGRWIKLTAESAEAVRKYGLMPAKNAPKGVSHAMIGSPGDIRQWLQIDQAASVLLSGPFALSVFATIMQQRAMQQQMDEIVEYLQEIHVKVDGILQRQKDAVFADMIGVDLVVEEALTVREKVGRVSDVTWSKVQATGMTLARTQSYALRQLDAIAEALAKNADLGAIAKATREAEPQVREWLWVLARTVQLQEGVSVLELDRVLDAAPDELESHRLGLRTARQNRLGLIARSTERLLSQLEETVRRANSKVLLNPIDAPAAVKSSNHVAMGIVDFRGRLGIESGHESREAKRWILAAGEARDKVLATTVESAALAGRFGADTIGRATEAFRAVDVDGDGAPDRPRAVAAAEEAGAAIKGAASGVAGAFGTLLKRKAGKGTSSDVVDPEHDQEEP